MNIDDILKIAIAKDASDIHLKVGNHPQLRIHGGLASSRNFPGSQPKTPKSWPTK